jgi:hypothetical protein
LGDSVSLIVGDSYIGALGISARDIKWTITNMSYDFTDETVQCRIRGTNYPVTVSGSQAATVFTVPLTSAQTVAIGTGETGFSLFAMLLNGATPAVRSEHVTILQGRIQLSKPKG